jgi:predicted nuclease of predicted toxin-antitoxin system
VRDRHLWRRLLANGSDERIFAAARAVDAIVITKDADFVRLLERDGPPPRILWLTVGNIRNEALRAIVEAHWEQASAMFVAGERLVEIGRPG